MKILVFGANGMLGRYVYTYLRDKFENVVAITRESINALDLDEEDFEWLELGAGDVIVNCMGLIKQRDDTTKLDFVLVNSLFPLELQRLCADAWVNLIHVSTDCVFDGVFGGYDEYDKHNANDVYGMSKSLGEPEEATVIRTSIIGEELGNGLSLLEWVKSSKGKTVNGYVNHYWNGITCLQFAKICEEIISEGDFWQGVKHIFSPTSVSKYELINMISKAFDLNVNAKEFEAKELCDRTLTSRRNDLVFDVPELEEQLKELREYSEKLREG